MTAIQTSLNTNTSQKHHSLVRMIRQYKLHGVKRCVIITAFYTRSPDGDTTTLFASSFS